jgi:hypothetical protein
MKMMHRTMIFVLASMSFGLYAAEPSTKIERRHVSSYLALLDRNKVSTRSFLIDSERDDASADLTRVRISRSGFCDKGKYIIDLKTLNIEYCEESAGSDWSCEVGLWGTVSRFLSRSPDSKKTAADSLVTMLEHIRNGNESAAEVEAKTLSRLCSDTAPEPEMNASNLLPETMTKGLKENERRTREATDEPPVQRRGL